MHCTPSSDSPFSSLRRRKSKTPRNPASVLPLPVGEVSKIECGSNADGTQSNWACVNVANVSQNHRAKRGCKRANNWRGEAARTDRVTVFRGDSLPISPTVRILVALHWHRAKRTQPCAGSQSKQDYRPASKFLTRSERR